MFRERDPGNVPKKTVPPETTTQSISFNVTEIVTTLRGIMKVKELDHKTDLLDEAKSLFTNTKTLLEKVTAFDTKVDNDNDADPPSDPQPLTKLISPYSRFKYT